MPQEAGEGPMRGNAGCVLVSFCSEAENPICILEGRDFWLWSRERLACSMLGSPRVSFPSSEASYVQYLWLFLLNDPQIYLTTATRNAKIMVVKRSSHMIAISLNNHFVLRPRFWSQLRMQVKGCISFSIIFAFLPENIAIHFNFF